METKNHINAIANAFKPILLIALLVGVLSGCAGKVAGPAAPIFFPPPPDEPHLQFLMGISDSTDIEGKPTGFSLVLTGKEKARVIKKVGKAYGVTAANGKLYVCSTGGGEVIIIDFVKKTFDFLKGNTGYGALKKPVNAAVDREGYLYVADAGRKEIVVYNPAGDFVRAFGKEFGGNIVDVAVYGEQLFALDNRANEIRVLDRKTGEQARSFGKGTDAQKTVSLAANLTIDDKGFVYVSNIGSGNIVKYDVDGNFLKSFGKFGDNFGQFSRPRGIAVDHEGRIFVADAGHGNVQIFNKDARLLGFFGMSEKALATLNLPAGIAVTRDNLEYFQNMAAPGFQLEEVVFVVNQFQAGNPAISVYGLGEMQGKKPETDAKPADSRKTETR